MKGNKVQVTLSPSLTGEHVVPEVTDKTIWLSSDTRQMICVMAANTVPVCFAVQPACSFFSCLNVTKTHRDVLTAGGLIGIVEEDYNYNKTRIHQKRV